QRVVAVPEKADFESGVPLVEGYTVDLARLGLEVDFTKMAETHVEDEPTAAYVLAVRGMEDHGAPIAAGEYVKHTRAAFYEATRPQQVLFDLTKMLLEVLAVSATGPNAAALRETFKARHQFFPQLMNL